MMRSGPSAIGRTVLFGCAVLVVELVVVATLRPLPWGTGEARDIALCVAASTLAIVALARMSRGIWGHTEPPEAQPLRSDDGKSHMALALGVSHEIRQPLFVIQLAARNVLAQMATGTLDPVQAETALMRIGAQTDKAIAIAARMLDLARAQPRPSEPVALSATVKACVADWQLTAPDDSIDISVAISECPDPRCLAMVDPVGFEQVVTNALDNAADSIARRKQSGWEGVGRIEIALACEPGRVTCRIRDNGAGVDPRTEQRAFEPFYSTKPTSVGGFGLFLSHEIISRAGGTIELVPGDQGGATLAISLPAV